VKQPISEKVGKDTISNSRSFRIPVHYRHQHKHLKRRKILTYVCPISSFRRQKPRDRLITTDSRERIYQTGKMAGCRSTEALPARGSWERVLNFRSALLKFSHILLWITEFRIAKSRIWGATLCCRFPGAYDKKK
jgi:hypothetical protein